VQIQQHADWVMAIAFSHVSTRIVSASRDRTCRSSMRLPANLEATYVGHESPVKLWHSGRDKTRVIVGDGCHSLHGRLVPT